MMTRKSFRRTWRILFVGSTFLGKREWTMNLLEKLAPLKIRWSALWNVHRAPDRELMQLAKKSGILYINMGVEGIKPETLDGMNKTTTPIHRLEEVIRILRELGISFSFNLIYFGGV